ncbi:MULTISPECIES: hypothetical protein [Algibacter]|uniref:Uncharacterized protein n=1 Tax=Algibacter lectus TaxID=221126 RepID=A0A090VES3_9FLAO|nr:hypothetical protein [Algibacter lectus]MWW25734.1 hypothetical protein [Algibacter lectus]TDY61016.1 hypothetical protein DFQ06_3025 [Algibacter lectus]GAL63295.1 hypothetical protein JCM19300_1317 [Algibacter lectus]SFD71940.1 hypothetical protein SAMN04489722_1185 [Algibacter lectus]
MKKHILLLAILITSISFINCESDPCDEGYTQLDNGVCVPDYITGIEQKTELGNVFFHSELGAVTYKNGSWFDENNSVIKNINN